MTFFSIVLKNMPKKIIYFILLLMIYIYKPSSNAQLTPALFIFGDSLVDVGNNNHLPLSILKADFPHSGIDFPTHKSTGRFSNGKNAADFLAEKLGLSPSPPYLYLTHIKSSNFVTGVSFASGGAGIFDSTLKFFRQSITMNKQLDYFGVVQGQMVQQLGVEAAQTMLSQSLFVIVIGSNDIFGYGGSDASGYVSSMLLNFKGQLQRLYDMGGRKFAIFGISAVGCCPTMRLKNKANAYACDDEANSMASNYNKALISLLQGYQTQLTNFQYTYVDTYAVFSNLIQQPATYGFNEEKAACCGLGKLRAEFACTPISIYCSNRSDHVFWDLYHPTEAVAQIIIETAFNGPPTYAFPVNLKQLVSA